MLIKVDEISELIRQKIEGFAFDFKKEETGVVISIGDGIARIYGLDNVMYNELLEFPGQIYGIALNLEEDNVGSILLAESHKIKEGDIVKRTGPHHFGAGRGRGHRPRGQPAGEAPG